MPPQEREKWILAIPTERLIMAARRQEQYHLDRARWWSDQLRTAEAALRAHGIELRDQPVTGDVRVQAVLDPERLQRLEECRRKRQEHEREAESYHAYRCFLEEAKDLGVFDLPLSVADFQYLNVRGEEPSPLSS
jgi:hypothetical protein